MADLQGEVLVDRPVQQLPGGGLHGYEESSSDSVRGMSPSLVSKVRSITRSDSRKMKPTNLQVKSSFGSFSEVRPRYGGLFESAPQEQDENRHQQHSRGGAPPTARYVKSRFQQRRPNSENVNQQQTSEFPDRMTSTKQQRNHLRNMLRRRKSSLIRTNSIRVSPQPGSLRGLPYDHTQINANQSPVMLVRKRSQRSLRGSPVRRFFRRLFRRKAKPAYHFTKQDLKRSLSFEIRESPNRAVKYEIKSMQLLRFKPKFKHIRAPAKATSSSKPSAEQQPHQENEAQPHMYSPAPLHAAQSSSLLRRDGQSDHEEGFQSFDYDYRERQPSTEQSLASDEAAEKIEDIAPLPEISRQRTRLPSTRGTPETREFQRKRSIINRSHSNRSIGGPLIRRVDLYDNPNPALVLEAEDEGKLRSGEDATAEPEVEEALAFVETWSHYLRRAVAVRVVLRQEIHSIEAREEAEWQKRQNRRSVSSDSSADSLYSNSSSDTTATTASLRSDDSRFSDASHEDGSDSKSIRDDDSSSIHHGDQSSLGHTLSISTIHSGPTRGTDFAYQQARDFQEQQERIDAIKKSLEQGQIYEKYSSLVRPNASKMGPRTRVVSEFQPRSNAGSLSSTSHLASDSNLVRPKQAAVRNITPLKVARPLPTIPSVARSRNARSVSGPAFFHQRSRSDVSTPSPLVHAIPEAPSPILTPASPGSKRSPSLRRETRSIKSSLTPPPVPPKDDQYMAVSRNKQSESLYQHRNVSDQILQDMYHELEELQQRSAQLSHLVRSQRDSAIETSRRTSLASHSSHSSNSSSGADLSRGRGNRRRPRSKVYLEKRESVLDTPWTVQPRDLDDDDDNSDARSEDSGVTFEGSPTHWRGSIGKHPLLIEVGDASRPPSASSRF